MQVVWSRAALRDAAQIFNYLLYFNPHAAAKVFDNLIQTGDGLANFPRRGRPVRGSEMLEVVTRYPYIIRYRITPTAIQIVRIRHMARQPTKP